MKRYVEIGSYIISLDNIEYIMKRPSLDALLKEETKAMIVFTGGDALSIDERYYNKLKEILSPLCFKKCEFELDGVNDFPGDNMIEE